MSRITTRAVCCLREAVAIRRLSDARLLVPFWYGLRKGYRGRFGMYLPPLLEALGKVELTHELRNNKARALV
jgi:hypothetical protein